jgi:hypothetical protein
MNGNEPRGPKSAENKAAVGKSRAADGVDSVSLAELSRRSFELRKRIEEAKRRIDIPIDSALGDAQSEERTAHGRSDAPKDQ